VEVILYYYNSNKEMPHTWRDSWVTEARSALPVLWQHDSSSGAATKSDWHWPIVTELCKNGDLPGEFVLQHPTYVVRAYCCTYG